MLLCLNVPVLMTLTVFVSLDVAVMFYPHNDRMLDAPLIFHRDVVKEAACCRHCTRPILLLFCFDFGNILGYRSTKKRVFIARLISHVLQVTQQRRPESASITTILGASKCKVEKPH